jgi:putative nucleotidyltransferase with HDIG domain
MPVDNADCVGSTSSCSHRQRRRERQGSGLTYARGLPLTRGLTACKAYTPSEGGFKGLTKIFRRNLLTPGPKRRLYAYVAALGVAATAMVVGLVWAGFRLHSPLALVALCLVALVAERESIRLNSVTELSVVSLVYLFAGAQFGPLAAVLVGAVGLLVDLPRSDDDQPRLRWFTWTAGRVLVAGFSGLAAFALQAQTTRSFGVILGAVAAASLVEAVGDLAFSSATTIVRGTSSIRALGSSLGPLLVASVPLYAPVVAVLVYAYREVSPWSTALFFIPAFAAHRLFLLYQDQRDSAEALAVANVSLERATVSFATGLVATLDARDRYTAGHSAAVAIYARDIAARMGLSEAEQQKAHLCGLVHDIGKIGLAPGLLEKQGPLTLAERRMMEAHPVIGERILRNVDGYDEMATIVRHHHERVDGHGYPDLLVDDAIPLLSRIIAVADAYNAMTSDRPYRDAMPSRVARLRIAQAVETQFDTSVVAAFEAILAGALESYRTGKREDFTLDVQDAYESALVGAA